VTNRLSNVNKEVSKKEKRLEKGIENEFMELKREFGMTK
jgi:hypothetical protein